MFTFAIQTIISKAHAQTNDCWVTLQHMLGQMTMTWLQRLSTEDDHSIVSASNSSVPAVPEGMRQSLAQPT